MIVLTVRPDFRTLRYALFLNGSDDPVLTEARDTISPSSTYSQLAAPLLREAQSACLQASGSVPPDLVVVRSLHGGDALTGPSVASTAVLQALEAAIRHAPLHLPAVLQVTRACLRTFVGSSVVVLAETAFFSQLPLREQTYGLDQVTAAELGVRRWGFHGLFHQAASESVAGRRFRAGHRKPARLLSICLEPCPEVAAVLGDRPVMVTSGATVLEGIPGETTSGELDPGVVLSRMKDRSFGPEHVSALLTRHSGMKALVGFPLSLEDVVYCPSQEVRLAREVLEYRLLHACGSAVATLGGLDAIVFSGRYARSGELLQAALRRRLACALRTNRSEIDVAFLEVSLDRVMADTAADYMRGPMMVNNGTATHSTATSTAVTTC